MDTGAGLPAPYMPEVTRLGWAPEGMTAPQQSVFDPAMLWMALVKRSGLVAMGVAIALTAGTVVTLLSRPTYTAQTTLQIDRESEKVVSSQDQTPVDNLGEEFFQTQYALLKSRALAIRVAETLDLARDETFINQMTAKPRSGAKTLGPEERRNRVIELLQSHEIVTPERGSRLVSVAFDSPDPALSAKTANTFAEGFISGALDRRFEASSYARDFLEKRLAQVKSKLEDSERDLVAYAASQGIVQLPGGGGATGQANSIDSSPSLASSSLESYNTALSAARTERIKAEAKWKQAQAATGVGLSDILQSPTYQTLSQDRAKLTAEYQDKLRIYKPTYPDMEQLSARIDETNHQLKLEAENIRESLRAQYEAALANEKGLGGQVEGAKSSVLDLRGRSIRYTILQREVDTNRTLYDGLLQRYKEVGVAGGVSANNISIVDRAEPPLFPSHPKPLLNMAFSLVAGLALGVLMAIGREALDQALRSPSDVEMAVDLPLLGAIPATKRGVAPKAALADSRSQLAEAYHSLRSALQFSTADGFPKTLMVTSPSPGGGKSTTAFAIAQYVARLGFRVLLVDADLRSPSVGGLVGATGEAGLSSLLTGAAVLREAVQMTEVGNLYVITAGPFAPNPAELLSGSRLQLLIAEASALFDMIVLDSPPVMGLADAPLIGSVVAGCLLVIEAGRTTRAQVRQSLRRMGLAGAHMLGTVLTKYKGASGAQSYGYNYGYDYGAAHGHTSSDGAIGGVSGAVARVRRLIAR
jgi:capsular exopolysaccharide synthesis family protein